MYKFIRDRDQFRRILSLGIMLFSGIGFKIFQFSASLIVWMIILFILNIKSIIRIPVRVWLGTGILIVLFILVFILKGATLPYFVIVAIISALFVLSNYFNNEDAFFSDFSKLLKFYMYYAVLTIPIMLFGSSLFNQLTLDYSEYNTFYWLFWFNNNGGPSFFHGFRPCGFTWEAGIWQLFLNLNFLFALYEKRSLKQVFLALLAVISVFSTTGIFLMCLVYLLYILVVNRKISARMLIPVIIFLVSYPLLIQNVDEKLNGKYSGSGMTRIADFFTGVNLLKTHPVFGADTDLAKAANNPLIWAIKENFWSGNYSDGGFEGFMNVSNCNGIIILLLDWGLPIGLYILFRTIKSNLFVDKRFGIVFMVIIYISMFTEPISRTSFFYFFILSSFLLTSNRNKSYEL